MLAKQSTALTVVVGPILDSTGAEYASAVIGDLSISKNGGTLTAMASAATLTYIANGMYTLVTTTANMDTLGAVQVTCNKATYQMPKMERNVVPASVYDAIITNATNATGGLPTATAAITGLAGAISTYAGGAVESVTNRVTSNVDQWNGSTVTGMPMPTYTQPAGFLAATFPGTVASTTNITAATGIVLSGVTHTGAVIPAVTTVTTVNELGENALTANEAGAAIPGYVWGALLASHTNTNTFGARIVRATNSNNEVQITGGNSRHIFAVLHDAAANSIPESAFQSGAVSARVIADNAIDAASIAAGALNGKGDWLTTLGASAPVNWINAAAIADGAIDAGSIADGALNGKGNWLTSLGANAPAGWINAASITTDAITNDKIAASAVTEITVNLFKYGDIQRWNSPANQIDVTITKV